MRIISWAPAMMFTTVMSSPAQDVVNDDSLSMTHRPSGSLPGIYARPASGENVLEQILTDSDESDLLEKLLWMEEHPFDLNEVTREELESIPGVTGADASTVLEFRKVVRRFESVQQLAVVQDVGQVLLQKLRPYVMVRAAAARSAGRSAVQIRSRMIRDSHPGDEGPVYTGSLLKSYNRISITGLGPAGAGALFEKDAGERFSNGFVSGHVTVSDWWIFSDVILGDYTVEAGQGLVLWRGSAFGKGSESIGPTKRSGLGPRPYLSADEFSFFRGAALSSFHRVYGGDLQVSLFYSGRQIDGTSDSSGTLSGFYESGLFRTDEEMAKRNAATERLYGGRVRYVSTDDWNFGASSYHSSYDKRIVSDRTFEFAGSAADAIGVDADMQMGRISLFGEAAHCGGGGWAGVAGMVLRVGRKATMALHYRDYSPRFNNLHANGFGENGLTKNERAMYLGVETPVTDWLMLSAYFDHFKSTWRTFSNPLPVEGYDIFAQTDASISPELDLTGRFSLKTTQVTEPGVDPYGRSLRVTASRSQLKVRCSAAYKLSRDIRVRGRLETTGVDYSIVSRGESGRLFYQEIQYAGREGLFVEGRLIFFDTDSYDSRLYEYENDVRGTFSNPALYGRGMRWYLLLRYELIEQVHLSAKYSETQKEAAPGPDAGGEPDSRVSVQVDVRL